MLAFLTKLLLVVASSLRSRAQLQAEVLFLRQQVLVLKRNSGAHVRLRNLDRLILVWLYRLFPALLEALAVAKPQTLIGWHPRFARLLALAVSSPPRPSTD